MLISTTFFLHPVWLMTYFLLFSCIWEAVIIYNVFVEKTPCGKWQTVIVYLVAIIVLAVIIWTQATLIYYFYLYLQG